MSRLDPQKFFQSVISLAAFSFLFWTLCSPTFLDVSTGIVDKSLSTMKKASESASTQMASLVDQLIR